MSLLVRIAHLRAAVLPVLRVWLVFLGCAAAAALWLAALQRLEAGLARPAEAAASATPPVPRAATAPRERPALPPTAFAPTFADAAASLRAGRHAEAYGRFVALADEGDVDAARIALVMHRFGPELFGSQWDASREQLAEWTAWSDAAARRDLASGAVHSGGRSAP